MIKIQTEFSTHSKEYGNHNIIQQIVAKAIVRDLKTKPKTVLELGCGSGQIFQHIDFPVDYYKAIDFSQDMCDLHPKANNLDICCFDFDSQDFYDSLSSERYDMILSSSALQWSKDLDRLLSFLSTLSQNINTALFTSNTFKTIFEITKKQSPILSKESIIQSFNKAYNCTFETFEYKLEFKNKKELFDYIKRSGVRGGVEQLNYKDSKNLYMNYPHNYLEFEVIFVSAISKS